MDFFLVAKTVNASSRLLEKTKLGVYLKKLQYISIYCIPELIQVVFSAELQQHYLPIVLMMLQLVIGMIKWNNRMILIIEIILTDIFTKSKSIKLFEKNVCLTHFPLGTKLRSRLSISIVL
jgi:hypothetical protein